MKRLRVIWQVTDTTGIQILGRTQAKLMNYISFPEIHAPQQQQSSVSQDGIKSTDPKFNQKFDWKFDQLKFDQTAQEEHRL